MRLGTLAIRGVVGPLFIGHGTQKLFGWFGGHGLEGTAGFFEQALGLRPGKRHATVAGASEALGGLMLTLGAMTPLAGAMISGAMVTAIRKVHGPKGPWASEGGYEYNAVILATMVAISESGPGRPSVDAAMFPRMKGAGWALLQLAAGAAGSYLATEVFNEEAPAADQAQASDQSAGDDDARFGRETAEAPSPTPSA
ncbi:MAG: putative oxidoreductase [Solirubrobacteraceae bacterium]|nr:putative oxidoreductase [Solirubrobacteraceae bacterium]